MTPERPKINNDGKYSVTQAAQLLAVHRVTIWRYVHAGKLRPYLHSANSRTRFLGKDLMRLWEREQ